MEKVECEVVALSTSQVNNGAYALLLKEVFGKRRLPIIIGQCEAQAIALELEGVKPPRPLTHDLIKTLIENLGAVVVEVVIHQLNDNTFLAKIVLEVSALTNEIDARPSDAIAVALRAQAPIFVAESVLEQAAFIPHEEDDNKPFFDKVEEENQEESVDKNEDIPEITNHSLREAKVAVLQDQLRAALEEEDYERAAKIRDEITKLSVNN